MIKKKKVSVKRADANIFKELALPQPERLLIRAKVMACAAQIIRHRGLTQLQTAKLLGIPQSKVSCLMNGKLSAFSLDYLFDILKTLDQKIEIIIQPKHPAGEPRTISLAA